MSATLPPTAGLDRPSDFGEFWQQADAASCTNSVAPETGPAAPALTPAQDKRRRQLQGMVAGVISGLVSFTALAAVVYAVKRHNEAALVIAAAKAEPVVTVAAAPASAAQLTPTVAAPSASGAALAPATLTSRQSAAHPPRPHAIVAHPKPAQTRAIRSSSRKPLSR